MVTISARIVLPFVATALSLLSLVGLNALAQTVDPSDEAPCRGYSGPGGACYSGPGGGLYAGPGDGLYSGPGGGIYNGPPTDDGYKGPWGPCITGVLGKKWMTQHCPEF